MDCSEAQIVPLSKVLESKIRLTASGISAVRSIKAGPFPGPTPMAGFPEEYAARTMASPPVASITPMERFFSSSFVASMVVRRIQPTVPSGAPASLAARLMISTVSRMHFFALGWGLITMELPALTDIIVLYITVEVGFVEGISAATIPTGTPISISPLSRSSRIITTAVMSRTLSQVMALPSWFFNTLSCHTPKPVSSTAILASRSDWAAQAPAMARQISSSFFCGNSLSLT